MVWWLSKADRCEIGAEVPRGWGGKVGGLDGEFASCLGMIRGSQKRRNKQTDGQPTKPKTECNAGKGGRNQILTPQ